VKNYYIYIEKITAKPKLLKTARLRPETACLPRVWTLETEVDKIVTRKGGFEL